MDINSRIIQRVHDLIQPLARWIIVSTSDLCPGMAASEPVSRCEDELCSASRTDSVDSCLVIL